MGGKKHQVSLYVHNKLIEYLTVICVKCVHKLVVLLAWQGVHVPTLACIFLLSQAIGTL